MTREQLYETLPQQARVAEVGVYRGNNARAIVQHSHPVRLWLVDTWAWGRPEDCPAREWDKKLPLPTGEQAYLEVVKAFWDQPSVTVLRARSVSAARVFADVSLDWVYIDANHSYASAMEDLREWFPKVRVGGVLAGHDFNQTEVARAVNDFLRDHPRELHWTDEPVQTWWFSI